MKMLPCVLLLLVCGCLLAGCALVDNPAAVLSALNQHIADSEKPEDVTDFTALLIDVAKIVTVGAVAGYPLGRFGRKRLLKPKSGS